MSKIQMRRKTIATFDGLFDDFIKSCKVKNLSPATLRYYNECYNTLRQFQQHILLEEINHSFVQDYTLFLQERMSLNSVNTRLRGFRSVCNYGYTNGYLGKVTVKKVKVDQEVKETYTDEQIRALLNKPNLKECSFAEYRNWVIINYLISTGNRLSTITNLKIKDVDLENQLITLRHTKNRTQQIIPLASSMCKILREYLQYRGGALDDYLFPSINDVKLTKSTIISAIKNYNLSRGVSMFSIHAFRRYFAKQCVLNGMDTFTLQRLGGWKDLEVVKNYIKIYATDIKNYDSINPLEILYSKTDKTIKM